MVNVQYNPAFRKKFEKIRDISAKDRVKKQIRKIVEHPQIGKPIMYVRKGTRELYVAPYRISYAYMGGVIILLDIYHKDEQ